MKVLTSYREMQQWSDARRAEGKRVGFAPTMGFLHEGHLSLVDLAQQHADTVVVSIFVNPTQFGPGEDYETYPRDEERDMQLCEERGVEAIYYPSVEEMYPEGYKTFVEVEDLGRYLCGSSRPTHFRGVTTVVTKLFNAVRPDVAVFGQKDAQQARIIQQMTADLQFGVEILLGPIAREEDGLAMSSRNVRLAPDHRAQAPALHRALMKAKELYESGERNSRVLIEAIEDVIRSDAPAGVKDYIEIVDWRTLTPVREIEEDALLAVAVKFGEVRLIDNIRVKR